MEIVYRLAIKSDVDLPVEVGTSSIHVDDAEVEWEVGAEASLQGVVIHILGKPMRFDDRGVILSTYPELESHAYRLSNYIANCLFKQTGFDAVDPEEVLLRSPELHAETSQEADLLANRQRTYHNSLPVTWRVQGNFRPDDYPALFAHSAALALYTDGVRVVSPFQKYELFYKVVEYFFSEIGAALDNRVSAHALTFDTRFNAPQIEVLRHLRNRSVHPRARRGHVNPEVLAANREVRANLAILQDLAILLLQHPPT